MSKWKMIVCCLFTLSVLCGFTSAVPQTGEVHAERLRADRFLDLLLRRPSFGTALERLAGFHVEHGTLDELVARLRRTPQSDQDSSERRLVAGMLQIQCGQGAEAVDLLQQVERERSTDAVASQAVALALRDTGDVPGAVAAFERALDRQPTKPARRAICSDLARLHHWNGDDDRSLQIWQQLEEQFPDDRAVREDVARRLQEDGQLLPALERWQSLASTASSPDQRIQYRLTVADVQRSLGRHDEARQTLESVLERIRPGSWLDDVVHRKLESMLLAAHGRQGVISYYRGRLDDQPGELSSVTRMTALLKNQGDFREATAICQQAIERHPTAVELRTALIDLFVVQGKSSEAVAAGLELVKLSTAGTDAYELVGNLLLRDPSLAPPERRRQASRIWMLICGNRQNAAKLGYAARLHRRSGMLEQAVELYQQLTDLEPDNPVWSEELGETLYELGRRDEALSVWNAIAAGPRRNSQNLSSLSEILERSGEFEAALDAMQQACELRPEIGDHIRLARLLRAAGQRDAAYARLDTAAELADSTVEQRIVLEARLETWKQDPLLYVQADVLQQRIAQNSESAEAWLQLAHIFQIDHRPADAVRSIERATRVDSQSIPAWQAACEIYLAAGLLERAAAANRELARLSPQNRRKALQQVVYLEQQLGRMDQALDAAEQLVSETPGHADSCRQFADMCFASGRDTDGLNCLRQCVRLNPDDVQLCIELAELLAARFQSADAESLLWQSFSGADDLDRRLLLVDALIRLAKQTGAIDRVIDRLNATASLDPIERRLCVASAWALAENPGRAQATLEQASQQLGRDVRILKMQVELAESQNQLDLATRYQQQVTALSTEPEEQVLLADLQFRTGHLSESELSWIRDARSGRDATAAVESIDHFLDAGRVEAAELMSRRLAAERPHDWRVLYRLAVIQWRLDRRDQAAATLRQLISLDLPPDHVFANPRGKVASSPSMDRAHADARSSVAQSQPRVLSPLARRVNQIAGVLTWLQLSTGDERYSQTLTTPHDYGAARCAAVSLLWLQQDAAGRDATTERLADSTTAGECAIADWCAIAVTASRAIRGELRSEVSTTVRLKQLLQRLADSKDLEHQLVMIGLQCGGGVFAGRTSQPQSHLSSADLLPPGQLLAAAEAVALERPEWLRDVGGWATVYRLVEKSDRSAAWAALISRLSESSRPGTIVSATDLAIASGDLNAVGMCLRKSLSLRSQIEIRNSLQARSQELAELALRLATEQDEQPLKQVIDLLLELQAGRFVPITGSEAGKVTGYRLDATGPDSSPVPPTAASIPQDSQWQESTPDNRGHLSHRSGFSEPRIRGAWKNFADIHSLFDENLVMLLAHLTTAEEATQHAECIVSNLEAIAQDRTHRVWIPASICLAWIHAVQQRQDLSMLALVPVAEKLPEATGLHLHLARHLRQLGADAEALAVVSRLPRQHRRDMILQTEKLVLELCVELNDQQRARQASSRLFELRLDRTDVETIVAQLSEIGLTEAARRFNARLPQDPGGRSEGLYRLMQQYYTDGKTAAAARIARQFVLQPAVSLDDASVAASIRIRSNAMEMLAACQAVRPVIRELQIRVSDQSASVHQRHLLIELLRLDGRNSEAEQIAESLRQSLLDDPERGLQLARQLERQGRLESACDLCRYLLEADPNLFHRDYYRFIRLFERNHRLDELADLVMATEFGRNASGHWGVQQLAERLLPLDESRGLQLFSAAWSAWPASRSALLANVSHEAVWSLPAVFEYSSERLLPAENRQVDPWSGVAEHVQVRGRGLVTGTLSRMLHVPVVQGTAGQFLNRIEEALEIQPNWHAGRIYAALLEARLGHTDRAFQHLSELLEQYAESMPPMVAWVTASELHRVRADALDGVIVKLLDELVRVQEAGAVLLKSGTVWHAGPEYLLAQYLALTDDFERVNRVLDTLLAGMAATPDSPPAEATPENQSAIDDLAALLRQQHPRVADRLQAKVRAQQSQEQTDGDRQGLATNPVIQAIRERLIPHGS